MPLQRPGAWTTWQLRGTGGDPLTLAHLALRTTSDIALDAVARRATLGRRGAADVVDDPSAPVGPAEDAAALALALAGLGRSQAELAAAAAIYLQLWSRGDLASLAPIHHQGLGQALFLAGRHEELRRALPDLTRLRAQVRHDLEVDLANPHLDGLDPDPAAHTRWQDLLGARFVEAGLEPVLVPVDPGQAPGATHLFDRLTAGQVAGTVSDGPLVTVIMPCYRPDEGLLTSIASIRDQSWAHLEILVVDDASGPDHEDLFARAVALDDRARLIRLQRNGGSYLARNAALPEAKGEFVTFQDADDWSHPRRLEHQVAALQSAPDAPASRSRAVRARDDLTHQWFGYRAVRDNASSLMVRREVLERVGPFVSIRKGADSEYAERLTTLAGPLADTGTPLAITRLRTGSLSRGDFTYQWASPERLLFKGSYRAWHARLVADQDTTHDRSPGSDLSFPVPRSFVRALDSAPDWDQVSVAYLADFSAAPTPELIARTAQHSSRVQPLPGRTGLWHAEALTTPLHGARREMHPDWWAAILDSAGQLTPLTRLEDIRVQRLVVLDPRVLLLAGAQECRLQVDRVDVELTPQVCRPDDSGLPVDLLGVADVCRSWWGLGPRWVAAPHLDGTDRAELAELVPGLLTDPAEAETTPHP